jgi:hypothetical protein
MVGLAPVEPDLTGLEIDSKLVAELDPLFHLVLDVGGRAVRVADAEHLVASKLGSRRPKDLRVRDELETLATPNG